MTIKQVSAVFAVCSVCAGFSCRAGAQGVTEIVRKTEADQKIYYVTGREVARQWIGKDKKVVRTEGAIPDGIVKTYSGEDVREEDYKGGVSAGVTRFYEKGQLVLERKISGEAQTEALYKQGRIALRMKKSGGVETESWAYYYHPNGKLKALLLREKGVTTYVSMYDENGEITHEKSIFGGKNKTALRKTYYPGKVLKREYETRDGKITGLLKVYYPSGKLRAKIWTMNEKLSGTSSIYYDGGKIFEEETYGARGKMIYKRIYEADGHIRVEGRVACTKGTDKTDHCYYVESRHPVYPSVQSIMP